MRAPRHSSKQTQQGQKRSVGDGARSLRAGRGRSCQRFLVVASAVPLRADGARRSCARQLATRSPGAALWRRPRTSSIGDDFPPIGAAAAERLGYPTQKPEKLLERIVSACSNETDLVLDPFCGCGTSIAAAQKLNRRWIGIDITHLAINLIKVRLADAFGAKIVEQYKVIGEPTDLEGARSLADQDKYQFQYWALGLVNARPAARDETPTM